MRASVTIDGKKYEFEFVITAEDVNEIRRVKGHTAQVNEPRLREAAVANPFESRTRIEGGEPSSRDIEQYVESLGDPDMTHTITDISEHFFGKRINSSLQPEIYNRLFRHVQTAQRRLQVKYGRKFERISKMERISDGRTFAHTTYTLRPSIRHGVSITDHSISTLTGKPVSGVIEP